MIQNPKKFVKFEKDFLKNRGNLTHGQALSLVAGMWREARNFGILPAQDPLEGIDVDIRIAEVLNSCLKNSSPE